MKKLKSIKSLKNKAERLWKDVCYRRDGKECVVRKNFPEIRIRHTQILQVDHYIGRSNKHLFLEPSNGTVVCNSCNQAKHYNRLGVREAIRQIVINREGQDIVNRMVALAQTQTANADFSKRWWLEGQIEKLGKHADSYRKGKKHENEREKTSKNKRPMGL